MFIVSQDGTTLVNTDKLALIVLKEDEGYTTVCAKEIGDSDIVEIGRFADNTEALSIIRFLAFCIEKGEKCTSIPTEEMAKRATQEASRDAKKIRQWLEGGEVSTEDIGKILDNILEEALK